MSNEIWINDPTILLKHENLKDLWPLDNMSVEEKINSITRLIIILTLVGYLITFKVSIIFVGILGILAVIIFYYNQKNNKKVEGFSSNMEDIGAILSNPQVYELNKNNYENPSENNPFMNVTLPQIYYDPKRKAAAPSYNEVVDKNINKLIKKNVIKNLTKDDNALKDLNTENEESSIINENTNLYESDELNKKLFGDLGEEITFNRSLLPFTATANTQVPNDQKSFQEFLYGDMISGKEGNPIALERTYGGAYNYTMY